MSSNRVRNLQNIADRLGNYVWNKATGEWIKEPLFNSIVSISGVTPTASGRIPVDTELTLAGDIILEDVQVQAAPLTEVHISGVTVTADGKIPVDTEISVEPQRFQATIQSFDATTPTQVKAKTADNKMYLTTVVVCASGAMSVRLQDDAGTPNIIVNEMYLADNSNIVVPLKDSAPLVVTTNQDLDVVTNVAGGVTVLVAGYLAS